MSNELHLFDELFKVVEERKDRDPKVSYIAKLHQKGIHKIAKKVGEEAVEVLIEAVKCDRKGTIDESADLLIHLLVLWSKVGVTPDDVMQELARRRGISGIDEKANRVEDV